MYAWKDWLFSGNNLEILRSGRIPVESVDLINIFIFAPLRLGEQI